jgi:hypothetical protein
MADSVQRRTQLMAMNVVMRLRTFDCIIDYVRRPIHGH